RRDRRALETRAHRYTGERVRKGNAQNDDGKHQGSDLMMQLLLAAATEKSALKWMLGALHPGIVHFPIALLAAAALLEVFQLLKKRREPAGGTIPLTWLSAATAVPA